MGALGNSAREPPPTYEREGPTGPASRLLALSLMVRWWVLSLRLWIDHRSGFQKESQSKDSAHPVTSRRNLKDSTRTLHRGLTLASLAVVNPRWGIL